MTFYDDPPDDLTDHEGWRTALILVAEPYKSMFKLQRPVRRYDLISNLAKRLGFPPGDLRPTTEQLLWDLYDLTVEAAQLGVLKPEKANGYLHRAIERQDLWFEEAQEVVGDLRSLASVRFQTSFATFEDDAVVALVRRLEPSMRALVGRATGTAPPTGKKRRSRRSPGARRAA